MGNGPRLVILGKQGAGKGTQCVRLAGHYVIPHISTGDIFRSALAQRNANWAIVLKATLDAGHLVDDETTVACCQLTGSTKTTLAVTGSSSMASRATSIKPKNSQSFFRPKTSTSPSTSKYRPNWPSNAWRSARVS